MKYLSSADPSVEEEKSEDGVSKLLLLELLSIAVCMLSKSVLKSISLIKRKSETVNHHIYFQDIALSSSCGMGCSLDNSVGMRWEILWTKVLQFHEDMTAKGSHQ